MEHWISLIDVDRMKQSTLNVHWHGSPTHMGARATFPLLSSRKKYSFYKITKSNTKTTMSVPTADPFSYGDFLAAPPKQVVTLLKLALHCLLSNHAMRPSSVYSERYGTILLTTLSYVQVSAHVNRMVLTQN